MLTPPSATLIGLCVALGICLLIGAEPEQSKDDAANPSVAEMRTLAVVGAGARVAYQRTGDRNPGMTTEFALPLTCV